MSLLLQRFPKSLGEFSGGADVDDHHIANVFLSRKRKEPCLEPAERHRDIRMHGSAQRFTCVAVKPRRQIDSEHQRSISGQTIDLANQPPHRLPDRLAGAGPEEGIDDQIGWAESIDGAPHRRGRIILGGIHGEAHPACCPEVHRRITLMGRGIGRQNDLNLGERVVEMTGQRQAIPAVVARPGEDQDPWSGHLSQHVHCDVGQVKSRILHQQGGWQPVLLHRQPIHLPHRLAGQDVGRGAR